MKCLAHLIRKTIAVTVAINQKAAQIGQWILDDLRELITKIAEAGESGNTPLDLNRMSIPDWSGFCGLSFAEARSDHAVAGFGAVRSQ